MKEEIWKSAKYYSNKDGILRSYDEIEVSNYGKVRYKRTGKSLNPVYTKGPYPIVQPYINKTQVSLSLHVLVASTFLKLPHKKSKRVVDHIDRNVDNNRLDNLRFTSSAENNKNRNKFYQDKIFVEVSKGKVINIQDASKMSRSERHNMNSKMFSSAVGLESNWFLFTVDTWNRLLEQFKTPDAVIQKINNGLIWKQVTNNYLISDIGLVKKQIKPNKSFYTFGRTNGSGYSYLPKFYNSVGTGLIHRVVATIFLNNGVPLKDNQLVDHINTERSDNSVNNLRICNGMSENLSNEITKRKITIPVRFTNELTGRTVYFCSRSDCMKRLGTRRVERWITSRNSIKLSDTLLKIKVDYITKDELEKYRNFEISFEFPDVNCMDDLKNLL